MKPIIAAAALLTFCLAACADPQAAPSASQPSPAVQFRTGSKAPLGRWITESGNLEVDIAPCGIASGSSLCGKVVRVLANRSMSAPGTDMAPADTRSPLGMNLLSALHDSGDGEYRGEIYNRENARTYSTVLTPVQPDQLLVRAYVGIPLFGKTQVWRRPSSAQGDAR